MAHERFRRFSTGTPDGDRDILTGRSMAVKAGNLVFLRGQTGLAPDGGFVGVGDPAAQAEQAMRNVKALLESAGSRMEHICKVTTYITDRAWREPVHEVIGRHLGEIAAVGTGLIVNGLALPEMLVEIDVDAVIPAEAA